MARQYPYAFAVKLSAEVGAQLDDALLSYGPIGRGEAMRALLSDPEVMFVIQTRARALRVQRALAELHPRSGCEQAG